jgi:hypothetical protein
MITSQTIAGHRFWRKVPTSMPHPRILVAQPPPTRTESGQPECIITLT